MFFIPLNYLVSHLGHNTNSSRMCGVLLHVEKVRALWLLCAAESVWEEKVQQLSWCYVSGRSFRVSVKLILSILHYMYYTLAWKIKCAHNLEETNSLTIKTVYFIAATWWTGWWMKQKGWQWTVRLLCVREQVEEEGWRLLQISSSACSTPSQPATSQVSHGEKKL